MAAYLKPPKLIAPISYPNIAHKFWDGYKLTGQYYLRPSKFSI